ncbi:MAG: hypothetical protein WD601_01650, partial [Pseudohongiellaceae bacterium]
MNLDEAKKALLARKEEIAARVERTHKHLYNRDEAVSPNFSEQIKQRENDELVQALDEEGREELAQIQQALTRIESGDYPFCSVCGKKIA